MSLQSERLVFAGGTDWSVDFLETLLNEGFNVVGVLTPADRKKDRGQKVAANTLKAAAAKLNIPVLQPERLSDPDFLNKFKRFEPDLAVVVAYGKIFSKEILDIPPLGFINFHPSLLPKLRGPSPIASAILEGFSETGVSIMKLVEGMDDGPVLIQEKVKIDPRETTVTLTRKLVDLGKKILPKVLKKYLGLNVETHNYASLQKQDNTKATYCKIFKKEDGRIDWQKETAEQIDRKIRALNPQIKTFTFMKNKRINILETQGFLVEPHNYASLPYYNASLLKTGEYKLSGENLAVKTKGDILLISELQVEGKKPTSAEEFFRGYGKGSFS